MALRSEQARVLRRSLLGRLGRDLAAFTAAFASTSSAGLITVMPGIVLIRAISSLHW